jgi:hypothetical protein
MMYQLPMGTYHVHMGIPCTYCAHELTKFTTKSEKITHILSIILHLCIAGFNSIEFLLWTWWLYYWKWHIQILYLDSRVLPTQMFIIFNRADTLSHLFLFLFLENLKHSMWVLHLQKKFQRYLSSWCIFWLYITINGHTILFLYCTCWLVCRMLNQDLFWLGP